MRDLSRCYLSLGFVTMAACGATPATDDLGADAGSNTPIIDAAPSPSVDAAPVATFDLSCFGVAPPTTATATLTASGATQAVTPTAATAVTGATVATFRVPPTGAPVLIDQVTSGSGGAYTTGELTTDGVPLQAYLQATKSGLRTSFLFPPIALPKSVTGAALLMAAPAVFGQLETLAGVTQDDANNGVIVAEVLDCAGKPIDGATLTVTQAGGEVGTQYVLGAAAKARTIVFNVPAGDTEVGASFQGMTFPAHKVIVFKNGESGVTAGSLTTTLVIPGA